jgi:hypothetical protein
MDPKPPVMKVKEKKKVQDQKGERKKGWKGWRGQATKVNHHGASHGGTQIVPKQTKKSNGNYVEGSWKTTFLQK